jgi:hypothetical protein
MSSRFRQGTRTPVPVPASVAARRTTIEAVKLREAIEQLPELDRDQTIYARRPWSGEAECVVRDSDEDGGIPKAITAAGFEYFLEVDVCFEVLEAFGTHRPTADEQLRAILFYAENDAWPGWVHTLREKA